MRSGPISRAKTHFHWPTPFSLFCHEGARKTNENVMNRDYARRVCTRLVRRTCTSHAREPQRRASPAKGYFN